MLKIAITGNIASGKSTVETFFQDKGFKVFDTDKIAHEILASSEEIIRTFGTNNRKELAKIVFKDKEELSIIELIIHPEVKKELEKIFNLDEKIVIVSVPQLFESGFDSMFDKIIYVTADESVRLERLMKRNFLTSEEAQVRINAQSDEGKAEKSDFVILNNGDLEELKNQAEKVLSILIG